MRVPRSIRVVDGNLPRLSKPPIESLASGHPHCSLIVGLPGVPNEASETWTIATNGATCVISPLSVLTDIKDEFLAGLVMPIPHGCGGFDDMTTSPDGLRTGTKKKKGGTEEVFAYSSQAIPEAVKSWRIGFDRLLKPMMDRLTKPTDERPIVYVPFTKQFIAEIANHSGDSFWLAIPAVRAQSGVYVSDSSPTIGGCDSGEAFAISLPFLDKEFPKVLQTDNAGLAKVLPKVRAKAAQITRFLRHLGSMIGKSVETDVPADW